MASIRITGEELAELQKQWGKDALLIASPVDDRDLVRALGRIAHKPLRMLIRRLDFERKSLRRKLEKLEQANVADGRKHGEDRASGDDLGRERADD